MTIIVISECLNFPRSFFSCVQPVCLRYSWGVQWEGGIDSEFSKGRPWKKCKAKNPPFFQTKKHSSQPLLCCLFSSVLLYFDHHWPGSKTKTTQNTSEVHLSCCLLGLSPSSSSRTISWLSLPAAGTSRKSSKASWNPSFFPFFFFFFFLNKAQMSNNKAALSTKAVRTCCPPSPNQFFYIPTWNGLFHSTSFGRPPERWAQTHTAFPSRPLSFEDDCNGLQSYSLH